MKQLFAQRNILLQNKIISYNDKIENGRPGSM